jgi:hypothetical protein
MPRCRAQSPPSQTINRLRPITDRRLRRRHHPAVTASPPSRPVSAAPSIATASFSNAASGYSTGAASRIGFTMNVDLTRCALHRNLAAH